MKEMLSNKYNYNVICGGQCFDMKLTVNQFNLQRFKVKYKKQLDCFNLNCSVMVVTIPKLRNVFGKLTKK